MKVDGHCHCGAIAYEAEVEPGTVTLCHCADCQMQSGSAFRLVISATAESFRILQGRPRKYLKTADSGAQRVQREARVKVAVLDVLSERRSG